MRNYFFTQAFIYIIVSLAILAAFAATNNNFFLFWFQFALGSFVCSLTNAIFLPKVLDDKSSN